MSVQLSTGLGIIIFASEIAAKSILEVRSAAKMSGFEDLVHDIRPRSQFIRAIHEVTKANTLEEGSHGLLRDKIVDSPQFINFQFSKKFVEEHGAHYDPSTVIKFDKLAGQITCTHAEIRDLAQQFYNKFSNLYLVGDITSLTKRFVEKRGAKRLALRDGIYFIPSQYESTADALKDFYKVLGFDFYVLPVNQTSVDKGTLLKIAANDMRKTVEAFKKEIDELKSKDALTPRIARTRIKELKDQLRQHQEVADSLRADLAEIVNQAGDAGQLIRTIGVTDIEQIVSSVQRGGHFQPLILDLVSAAEPEIMAKVQASRRALVAPTFEEKDTENTTPVSPRRGLAVPDLVEKR